MTLSRLQELEDCKEAIDELYSQNMITEKSASKMTEELLLKTFAEIRKGTINERDD